MIEIASETNCLNWNIIKIEYHFSYYSVYKTNKQYLAQYFLKNKKYNKKVTCNEKITKTIFYRNMSKIVSDVVSNWFGNGFRNVIFIFLLIDPGLIVKANKNPTEMDKISEIEKNIAVLNV